MKFIYKDDVVEYEGMVKEFSFVNYPEITIETIICEEKRFNWPKSKCKIIDDSKNS